MYCKQAFRTGSVSGNRPPELNSRWKCWDSCTWTSISWGTSPPGLHITRLLLPSQELNCGAAQGTSVEISCPVFAPGNVCMAGRSWTANAAEQPNVVLLLLLNCSEILFIFQYLIWSFCSLGNNTYLHHWSTEVCNNNYELFDKRCYWKTKVYYCKMLRVGNLASGTVLHPEPIWLLTMKWEWGERKSGQSFWQPHPR